MKYMKFIRLLVVSYYLRRYRKQKLRIVEKLLTNYILSKFTRWIEYTAMSRFNNGNSEFSYNTPNQIHGDSAKCAG